MGDMDMLVMEYTEGNWHLHYS